MLKNTESATGTNLCKNDMKKFAKDTANSHQYFIQAIMNDI